MIDLRIVFEDGNIIYTRVNGTSEEAKKYYLGKIFNTGYGSDNMSKCIRVDALECDFQTPYGNVFSFSIEQMIEFLKRRRRAVTCNTDTFIKVFQKRIRGFNIRDYIEEIEND